MKTNCFKITQTSKMENVFLTQYLVQIDHLKYPIDEGFKDKGRLVRDDQRKSFFAQLDGDEDAETISRINRSSTLTRRILNKLQQELSEREKWIFVSSAGLG